MVWTKKKKTKKQTKTQVVAIKFRHGARLIFSQMCCDEFSFKPHCQNPSTFSEAFSFLVNILSCPQLAQGSKSVTTFHHGVHDGFFICSKSFLKLLNKCDHQKTNQYQVDSFLLPQNWFSKSLLLLIKCYKQSCHFAHKHHHYFLRTILYSSIR